MSSSTCYVPDLAGSGKNPQGSDLVHVRVPRGLLPMTDMLTLLSTKGQVPEGASLGSPK